jgi:hypothetical protein
MDYTDLSTVKAAMDSQESVKDAVLAAYITRASRLIDRLCTSQPNVSDYFKAENVANEILLNGVVDFAGRLTVYPHKPIVNSVSAMAYRYSLREAYKAADLTLISLEQEALVFEGSLPYSDRIYVQLSYNGGLGATLADLPADLVDVATLMAVRLYKEERAGLGDSIGVAELGVLVYTKAFPQRALDTLMTGNYIRTAPWI